ncbi:UNVERIFIED_CONTAM: hypothetical protein PYX00_006924 [Menopon gallinae]|uniref:C2H2-type domain-containing protein n=1 Tax=Menopon gallinae TaxID=328185 RepID=A0AAW2HHU5_9NEOP
MKKRFSEGFFAGRPLRHRSIRSQDSCYFSFPGTNGTTTFDLFDSETGQDLTLSPPTFANSTEAFVNDNSDSLGVPGDADTVGSSEDVKNAPDSSKLSVKKSRPKAASPNRQGPQQCQVCGKVFGNASALAKHKLTHSDERKYVCTMCGKAFKRQDHLNGHMLTHRNKKPYECKAEGCGKSYCDARSLRRHTENHHTGGGGGGGGPSGSREYAPPPAQQSQSYPASSSPASSTTGTPAKAPSHLQQLLSNDSSSSAVCSTSSSKGVNNDGLTKQQLDLIHQIMQQTQQSSGAQKQPQKSVSSSSGNSGGASTKTTTLAKTKTWALQVGHHRITNNNCGGESDSEKMSYVREEFRAESDTKTEKVLFGTD